MQILKLPRFFSRLYGEWKSAPISKCAFSLTTMSRSCTALTLIAPFLGLSRVVTFYPISAIFIPSCQLSSFSQIIIPFCQLPFFFANYHPFRQLSSLFVIYNPVLPTSIPFHHFSSFLSFRFAKVCCQKVLQVFDLSPYHEKSGRFQRENQKSRFTWVDSEKHIHILQSVHCISCTIEASWFSLCTSRVRKTAWKCSLEWTLIFFITTRLKHYHKMYSGKLSFCKSDW